MAWLAGGAAVLALCGGPAAVAQPAPGAEVDADWHTLRTPPLADGQFELITLSTLPDAVTGGDVLVAVRGLGSAPGDLVVTRDGVDVTDAFHAVGEEQRGLVTGLPVGASVLEARARGQVARLVVRNHPVTGPVLSGPHQTPFRCETEAAGLGAPLDDDCSVRPHLQWFYRSSLDQGFHELADPYAPYPGDVMTTQTDAGDAVPFVVRVESRTINRGIARMAVLDDPARRGLDAPFEASSWDHRVYYAFGESCGVGYHQGVNHAETVLGAVDVTRVSADNLLINLTGITDRLAKGDITVHSTLTSFGVHCNPLVSVETAMMIKEHLSEQYGLVEAIVGTNGSGAALQQYNALNNAPGLLAAAMPTATFADIATTAMTVTDCGLLQRYYAASDLDWTDAKKAAVNGHNLLSGGQLNAICQSWTDAFLDRIDPSGSCAVPKEDRYDAATNPKGVRCTIQDANVNIFGRDPATGFARRPLDNVGVQYGLGALRAGVISMAEFVDLNTKIGGYDIDGNPQPARHEMSSDVARLTYQVGGVIGRGARAETPVMDIAPYLDLIPVANIHESVRPFVIRARLRAQTGQSTTQAIWRGLLTQADAYPTMQEWLDRVLATSPPYGGDHQAAVAAARPASAYDRCAFGTIGGRLELPAAITAPLGLAQLPLLPGAVAPPVSVPVRVDVPEDFDSGIGPCALALPVVSTPRMVAGMPLSDDVIKCQRRPLTAADYPAGATDAQLAQLRAAFPTGVCDYRKPAAEDVARSMVWTSVGGEVLEAPHELHWRVARSGAVTAGQGPAAGGTTRLPATGAKGGAGVATLLLGLALLGRAMARRSRALG
jgi:hypothetical protein